MTGLTSPNLSYNALTGTYAGESTLVSPNNRHGKTRKPFPNCPIYICLFYNQCATQLKARLLTQRTAVIFRLNMPLRTAHSTLPSTTTSKSTTNYTATGLSPNTTYYFVVETFYTRHSGQANSLTSISSSEVSATTPSGLPCSSTATVTSTADSGTGSLRKR
ncbi:MAG: hypothetical protein R3E08_11825 [Thiotrichaceae bacterium]